MTTEVIKDKSRDSNWHNVLERQELKLKSRKKMGWKPSFQAVPTEIWGLREGKVVPREQRESHAGAEPSKGKCQTERLTLRSLLPEIQGVRSQCCEIKAKAGKFGVRAAAAKICPRVISDWLCSDFSQKAMPSHGMKEEKPATEWPWIEASAELSHKLLSSPPSPRHRAKLGNILQRQKKR